MAPELTPSTPRSLKRPSPDSDSQQTISIKKQKIEYRRHHRLQSPLNIASLDSGVIADDASVDQLLNMAIGSSLRTAGFELAEPVALDSFRDDVEEYMLRFLSYIRASMSSCRRTQPIPQDFEHALHQHSVSLDSLHPYLKQSRKSKQTNIIPNVLPTPPPEDPPPRTHFPFLGPELSPPDDILAHAYIPKHFPKFPSKHTYRDTPVFPNRETDPKKVRERATEEGRMGEEALRKLAHASKGGEQRREERGEKRLWGRTYEDMDSMFEKALKGVLRRQAVEREAKKKGKERMVDGDDMMVDFESVEGVRRETPEKMDVDVDVDVDVSKLELGPVVNCERVFWRRRMVPSTREQKQEGLVKPQKA